MKVRVGAARDLDGAALHEGVNLLLPHVAEKALASADVADHVAEVEGWAFADIPLGKEQPKEGAIVLHRCGETEKFATDRGAARAAKNAGIDCETQWPYYVSADGVRQWCKLIGFTPKGKR